MTFYMRYVKKYRKKDRFIVSLYYRCLFWGDTMNIAVVDDSKESAQHIKKILNNFADANGIDINVELFNSGEEFLSFFKPNTIQIIFMDIYMDKMSGVDVSKAIRKTDNVCLIIFLTTSLEHMTDAFACHAFEYVVKPAYEERIYKVMSDALEVIPSVSKYIEFVSKRRNVKLLLCDIVSSVSNGHYLNICDKNNDIYPVRMTLSKFIELTKNDPRFLTVNKGILINMDYIKSIEKNNCILTDGQIFPIKVRECALIEQKWQDYNFEQIRSEQNKILGKGN